MKTPTTPGVYIEEKSAFPNSIVSVPTAVPAFIGYTEKAMWNEKSLTNIPTRLSSFAEFQRYYGSAPLTTYEIAEDPKSIYKLVNPASRYLLFYSMKFFFANGGSDCYVVSIGDYDDKIKKADFDGEKPIKNSSGQDTGETQAIGIRTLLKEPEPTLLVIPDAVLLPPPECAGVQQAMLRHCSLMASRFAILDVPMLPEELQQPVTRTIVERFRKNIGDKDLQWGAAYYPYMRTTITGSDEISLRNIRPTPLAPTRPSSVPAPASILEKLLFTELENAKKEGRIDAKRAAAMTEEVLKVTLNHPDQHQSLLAISPLYKAIMESVRREINTLPPSGAMAGIYSMVDNTIGVYQSPANVSIGSVVQPVLNLTNEEQEDLNVPLDGKAVNAIRTFPGKGVLVWGARTLDGNSQDWRYISVRRTVIYIEQSIKNAIEPYVFESNTATTWTNVNALATNFLTNVWQNGALAGATPEDAFSVDVGLGITMTPIDILDGIMRVSLKIAVTRPAEFIVITFEQKMQPS